MQSFTTVVSPWCRRGSELVLRAVRVLTRREAPRPSDHTFRWAEMRPIDFDGEDTSLTEAQLTVLRR